MRRELSKEEKERIATLAYHDKLDQETIQKSKDWDLLRENKYASRFTYRGIDVSSGIPKGHFSDIRKESKLNLTNMQYNGRYET